MKIYPKISNQQYSNQVAEKIKQSEGIEIQYFDEIKGKITEPFDFETEIRKNKSQYPNLKEITVHPPLKDYDIELIILKDEKILKNQLKKLVKLSKELNIELNIIYHTHLPLKQYISTGLDKRMLKYLKIIEGSNVTILIENLFMLPAEENECSALQICKYINHPNLKMCLDTTHVHCKANIYKKDVYELIKTEFNKEDCQKYIKQIHFAAALNNDGYIDKKRTHGKKHNSFEDVVEDYNWLKELGLEKANYVTEVGEEDYYSRKDQLEEIEMLEKIKY